MRDIKKEWKDIPGYEGFYQVSTFGEVKSLNYRGLGKQKLLRLSMDKSGYKKVELCKNTVRKTFKIHQLVAIVFLGHVPKGYKLVVDHVDDDKLNNKVDNLQIVTQRVNSTKNRRGVSKYTGVFPYNYDKNKWVANIMIERKIKHLGVFMNEYDAHLAYQNELKILQA